LYIDDRVVTQVLPLRHVSDISERYEDVRIVKKGERAYRETPGLDQAPEKSIRHAERFTAWGTTVDGRRGTAGAPSERRALVCSCLAAAVNKGRLDKKSLERLVGSLVHPLQHRRQLMCVLSECYQFLNQIDYGRYYNIPGNVSSELIAAALLLPIASTNIRWPISDIVSASDATPSAFGICRAKMPSNISRGLFRISEHRGEHVRMDWSEMQSQLNPSRMPQPSAYVNHLGDTAPWRVTRSSRFNQIHHVNVQELEAMLVELHERAMESRGSGLRFNILVDSRVALGCWAKG
jgi:hypothetical protein